MGKVVFYFGITYCTMETEIIHQLVKEEKKPPRHFNPETGADLKEYNLPLHKQGFCIWFTGLSGAGKSTVANILDTKLQEHGRLVTLLDGDHVRTHLSKGLGFTKEDRDTNIRRISFVASEIVKHGGAVVCAAISPYRAVRNECRLTFAISSFIEVFMDTPLEVCEARDTKGLYSLARAGKLENFTGVNDPYEAPENPEIKISFPGHSPGQAVDMIINYLVKTGFLAAE
jgi:sulfate adenylyltransferase